MGGGGGGGDLTVPLGLGRVGSDNLGYGPGSGFSFEPVQTSTFNPFFFISIICDLNFVTGIPLFAFTFTILKVKRRSLSLYKKRKIVCFAYIYTPFTF